MPIYDTETREKIKIPSTNKQRVKIWGSKKAKEGGKNMSVWIGPETVKQIDELLIRYPDKNKASLVAFAIKKLFEQDTAAPKAENQMIGA